MWTYEFVAVGAALFEAGQEAFLPARGQQTFLEHHNGIENVTAVRRQGKIRGGGSRNRAPRRTWGA
jgi:hypothetical protein